MKNTEPIILGDRVTNKTDGTGTVTKIFYVSGKQWLRVEYRRNGEQDPFHTVEEPAANFKLETGE